MPNQYTPNNNPIPAASGVYLITCLTTGKIYVGSAINLRTRWQCHHRSLRHNEHRNPKLQRAFNKYGSDSFVFEVLELVLIRELLTAREQYWFAKLRPFDRRGFNLAPIAGSRLGMKNTPEHRARISASNQGRKASPETIEKLRTSHLGQPSYWTGKKRPSETSNKISVAKLGKPSPRYPGYTHSPEHREKLRIANIGKKQSEETRRKAGDARRGKPRSAETREKIRLAKLGHAVSPETIAKIRAKGHEAKTIIVTSPDGEEFTVTGIRQFCKDYHLDRSTLMRVAKGQCPQHKGYKARFPD